jgi:hypothetical protein
VDLRCLAGHPRSGRARADALSTRINRAAATPCSHSRSTAHTAAPPLHAAAPPAHTAHAVLTQPTPCSHSPRRAHTTHAVRTQPTPRSHSRPRRCAEPCALCRAAGAARHSNLDQLIVVWAQPMIKPKLRCVDHCTALVPSVRWPRRLAPRHRLTHNLRLRLPAPHNSASPTPGPAGHGGQPDTPGQPGTAVSPIPPASRARRSAGGGGFRSAGQYVQPGRQHQQLGGGRD